MELSLTQQQQQYQAESTLRAWQSSKIRVPGFTYAEDSLSNGKPVSTGNADPQPESQPQPKPLA